MGKGGVEIFKQINFPFSGVENHLLSYLMRTHSKISYLEKSSTEGFQHAFGKSGRSAVTKTSCNEEGCLLLDGWILVVHHSQYVLTEVL